MLAQFELIPKQRDRPDQDIQADVWAWLEQDDTTRALELSALDLEVHDNEVFLFGHVNGVMHRKHVAELVKGVRGVKAVHNELIADSDLVTEVAQALAADPRTRQYQIRVGAFHGWINLSGAVPNPETRTTVETVAARVAHVRGVLTLPSVVSEGAPREEKRRALQPSLGTMVYATDGPAGHVTQIIISPQNRLVSHIVVAVDAEVDRRSRRGQWVVPSEALAHVTGSGIFLSDSLSQLVARPTFLEANFPFAPLDWQPPFPYAPGTVRWASPGLL
jgi:osmotically-inducible protein OsmY